MFTRTLAFGAALAAAAFAVAACSGGPGGGGGNAGGAGVSGDDANDTLPPGNVVRVVSKNVAADGKVTCVLENTSGTLQEDLTYHVEFHYEAKGAGAIAVADDVEVSPERDLVLLKSDTAKSISIDNPKPGQKVKAAKLAVQISPPVAAVARDASNPGTFFLNHSVECVGMATEDEIRAGTLWIEIENVSERSVTELESRAVFVDQMTREKVAETKWATVKDLSKKGARARITYDLSGLGKVGHLAFLVKIRQTTL